MRLTESILKKLNEPDKGSKYAILCRNAYGSESYLKSKGETLYFDNKEDANKKVEEMRSLNSNSLNQYFVDKVD
jgi:hypothetical protein